MAMPFDTLKLARRLEAAGFPAQQAGDMSEAIAEAAAQLATKSDIGLLRTDIKAEIAELRRDMRELEHRMTIKLGGMIVIATGVILAGLKLIH